VEDRDEVIHDFGKMTEKHEKDWKKFVEKHYDF